MIGKQPANPLSVALAATKGGCGKTTLTACLAVHAAASGARVAMLDLDPQGSLTRWWHLRGKPDNPTLFVDVSDLAGDIAYLKSEGWQYIFIDTPPGNVEIVEEAIGCVDYAVLPTRVSALDVLAVEPTVAACRASSRAFGFVLSAYDPRWKLSPEAAAYLKEDGTVLAPPIQYRAAYASAMTLGRSGPESQDRKAAALCRDEIAELWRSILEAANG